jgi:hypothetical protein
LLICLSSFSLFVLSFNVQQLLCHSRPAYLDPLTSELVVTPQNWPACTIRLGQGHLQLGAQDPELALFWLDAREQRELGVVALTIRRSKVEVDVIRLEVNNSVGLVNFLEIYRCGDGGCGLVEVVSML